MPPQQPSSTAYTTLQGQDLALHTKSVCRNFRKILSEELKSNYTMEPQQNQGFVLDRIQHFDLQASATDESTERKIIPQNLKFNESQYAPKEKVCFYGECCVSLIQSIAQHSIDHFQQLSDLIEYWKDRETSPVQAMLEIGPMYWIKLAYNQTVSHFFGKNEQENTMTKLKSALDMSRVVELIDTIRMRQRSPSKDLNELLDKLYKVETCHAFLCGYLFNFLHKFQSVRTIDEISDITTEFLTFADGLFVESQKNKGETSESVFEAHFKVHPMQEETHKVSHSLKRLFFHTGIGPIIENEYGNRTPSPSVISSAYTPSHFDDDNMSYISEKSRLINISPSSGDKSIEKFLDKMDAIMVRCQKWYLVTNFYLRQYKKPNHFVRNWIRYTVGATVGTIGAYYAYKNMDAIVDASKDAYYSTTRFINNSIVEPIYNIYNIIHYDEHKHKLVSVDDVNVSMQSLERMILDFVKDVHPKMTAQQYQEYLEQAQRGDITEVMKNYEQELKNPISNAMFGNLARSLLIQVQKQKLAVEQSMISMDSLMKQNELNLEIVAAIPGVLVGLIVYYQLSSYKRKTDYSQITAPMARHVTQIEKVLNRNLGQSRLPLQDYGFIYLSSSKIKSLANKFSTLIENPRVARDFTSDLNEVNSVVMSPNQKYNVVTRIWRQYKFLQE